MAFTIDPRFLLLIHRSIILRLMINVRLIACCVDEYNVSLLVIGWKNYNNLLTICYGHKFTFPVTIKTTSCNISVTGLISSEDNVIDYSLLTCSPVRTTVQGMIIVSLPSPPIPTDLSASHTLSVTTDRNVQCVDDISVVYVSSSEPCTVVKTCALLETAQVQTVYSECLFNCTCATRNCEIRVACKYCGDSSVSVCTVESKGFEFTSSSSIP